MNPLHYFLPPLPERVSNMARVLAELDAMKASAERMAADAPEWQGVERRNTTGEKKC